MPAYIEDVVTELRKHHKDQSGAIIALNELGARADDFKAAVRTSMVNEVKAALSDLDCAECKKLATDFVGAPRPTA